MLEFITWNVNPQIFDFLSVRWYGLFWAIGIFGALVIVQKLYKHENLPQSWVDKQFIYVVLGTVLGARLGHCLFYEWHLANVPFDLFGIHFKYENYYITHPWQIFNIFEGGHLGFSGLASHGGAVGIIIAMYYYNKKVTNKGFLWGMDRLVIGAAITGMMIRLGNLMNSEIYGNVTTMPWGFNFPFDPQWDGNPHHPTQIYEALYGLVAFVVTWWMYWKKDSYKKQGLIFGVYLLIIFGSRFLLEFIKIDQEAFEKGMILNMGQLLSIPFIIWGIWAIVTSKNRIVEEKIAPPPTPQKKSNQKTKK